MTDTPPPVQTPLILSMLLLPGLLLHGLLLPGLLLPGLLHKFMAGTSRPQFLPASPSPLDCISPWRKAQRFAHNGICPLCILWPLRLSSRSLPAGLWTAWSGSRDAVVSVRFCFWTTRIWRPLAVLTALGTSQSAHSHSSVCRTSLPVISRWSSGRISCFPCVPSAYIHRVWWTCQPRTSPLPPSSIERSVSLYLLPWFKFALVLCSIDLCVLCLPGSQYLRSWGCLSVPGPSGSPFRGRICGVP